MATDAIYIVVHMYVFHLALITAAIIHGLKSLHSNPYKLSFMVKKTIGVATQALKAF